MNSPAIFSAGEPTGVLPEIQMLRLASGHVAAQAVYVFAVLGIADILREGPLTARALAPRVSANETALARLLRYLDSLDVVKEESEEFSLTRLGRTLCRRPSTAIRDHSLLLSSSYCWSAVGGLLYSVQTGEASFDHIHGKSLFDYLNQHRADAEIYNSTMSSWTRLGVSAILQYPFEKLSTIVDVGGGEGTFLTSILKNNPEVRGTVLDAPDVVGRIRVDPSLSDRLAVQGGNFFEHVPKGADGYILKRVLHDWDDDKSAEILRVIRAAIPRHGKLVICELAGPGSDDTGNDFWGLDMIMLVCHKGRERTERDFEALFAVTGFQLSNVIRTKSPLWIVEAMPV